MKAGKDIPEKNAIIGLTILEFGLAAAAMGAFSAGCAGRLDSDMRLSILYMLFIMGVLIYLVWSIGQALKVVKKSVFIKNSIDVLPRFPPEGAFETIDFITVDNSPSQIATDKAVEKLKAQADKINGHAIVIEEGCSKYNVYVLSSFVIKYHPEFNQIDVFTDLYGNRKAKLVCKNNWWNPFDK